MATPTAGMLSKVPAVTLGFWVIKGLATTLGETGGDALSMQMGLGYAVSTLVFLALFAATLTIQLRTAYVLTRPLGATLGDTLTKPVAAGGLALGQMESSLVMAVAIILGVSAMAWLSRRRIRN